MSEQTLQLLESIRRRLAQTVRRISLSDAAFGLVLTLALAAAGWLIATIIESQFWLPAAPRAVLFGVVLVACVGAFLYLAARPLLRLARVLPPYPESVVARRIGARYPEVGDRLQNLLDLSEGRSSDAPPEMLDGAVRMLGNQVSPVAFEEVEDFGRPRRALRLLAAPAAILILFAIAAPGAFRGASHRLVSVGDTFERPAPYALSVVPGDVELIRGADLETIVKAEGRALPESITLAVNHLDEEHVERIVVTGDSSGSFRHAVINVRRPLRYRAESELATSPWYEVAVLERPVLRGLQVSLNYPSYSGLTVRHLEPNVGDVTALAGTRVSVEVGVGAQQLEEAYLEFDDGSRLELNREDAQASASFTLRGTGSYTVRLRGEEGIENAEPIAYQLDVVPDEHPAIVLTSPESTFELDRSLAVPVGARIRDDFGFSDLKLFYRLAESRYKTVADSFSTIDLPLDASQTLDQQLAYGWDLAQTTSLDPVPGDVVEYFVRVWDNDAWSGFKPATSERFRLVVPSLAERYAALDEAQESAETALEDILEEADAVREQFQELQNELRQNQEGDWDNQRQIEQIQSRQAAMEERVEALGEQIDEMTQEMQTNRLVSEETVAMYDELRKVVEEISSPELREALQRLQEAVQNLDLQQLQESLGEFEFSEQEYRERLERTLDLFKKMRVQQQLDEAARRAEALAERQREMAERTEALQQQEDAPTQEAQTDEDAEQGDAEQPEDVDSEQADSEQADSEQADSEQADSERAEQGRENEDGSDESREESSKEAARQQDAEPDTPGEPRSADETAERMAQEQEQAQREAQELMERLEQTGADMEEIRNAAMEQMEQLLEQSRQQNIPQEMQRNADQLRQQQLREAQQGQQQMSQSLQQMSSMIRDMQGSMSGSSMNINIAGVRQALEDVLTLSQNQEAARQGVQQLAPDSPALRDFAQDQMRIGEGLSIVADSLQNLSREIPQMSRVVQRFTGDALRAMSEATTALADRSAREGAAHQKSAMTHLNELALVLADLLNQMSSGGGGGGTQSMQQMLQEMQQMAGQQEQLNQQIQQFINDMQGNRLASDAQQRLQQMAEQQQVIRQQLRDLSRNPEARGKLLGDLDRIADQMEETIQELRAAQTDRQTIDRQQQILTRLLQAQQSLRERGREEQREGRSTDDIFRESPGALPASEEAEQLRRDLLRALEAGYAPEYQELIKRYFELLQQQSAPPPAQPEP